MPKLLKGVIIYTFILLGIAFIVGMIAFGAMFLTAKSDKPITIFGYKSIYLTNKQRDNLSFPTESLEENTNVQLLINSGNFELEVLQAGDDTQDIIVKKTDNLFGVYKGEYEPNAKLTHSLEENGVFKATLSVHSPDGLVSFAKSKVRVILPTIKNFKYDVVIIANNGEVNLNGELKPNGKNNEYAATVKHVFNTLSVTTNKGNLVVNKIGSLDDTENKNLDKSYVSIKGLHFKTNGGRFNLSSIDRLTILDDNNPNGLVNNLVELEGKKGDFTFKEVIGQMKITGNNIRIDAEKIDTKNFGFLFDAPKGYFNIKELIANDNILNSINTTAINIKIGTLTGTSQIKTVHGQIEIETINSNVTLESESGNIKVSKVANGSVKVINQKGSITINEYKDKLDAFTTSGDISAKYTGTKLPENAKTKYVKVETGKGKVTLNGLYNELNLITTNSASVKVDFAQITTNADVNHIVNIKSGKAKINVHVPIVVPFRLDVGTGKNIKGELNASIADLIASAGKVGNVINIISVGTTSESTSLMTVASGSGSITFHKKLS